MIIIFDIFLFACFSRSISTTSSVASYNSLDSQVTSQTDTKHSKTMTIVEASAASIKGASITHPSKRISQNYDIKFNSAGSLNNPRYNILNRNGEKKSSGASSIASSILGFGRKHGMNLGRRKSSLEEPRNFQYEQTYCIVV